MIPQYFGISASPLYGVYHPAEGQRARKTGVVLCYPFGQEYMRAHRAFRQLSLGLAKAGFHVFRFDYTGSGDSAGDSDSFSLAAAVSDSGTAIDELCDSAELEQVVLLGVRLGGTIAALAASTRSDVSHLVLWDPVIVGASYLDELLSDATTAAPGSVSVGTVGVMGYPVTTALQNELRATTILEAVPPPGTDVFLMYNAETAEQRELQQTFAAAGRRVRVRHELLPGRWNEVDNWGSAMIPQAAIRSLIEWIGEEVP